MICMHFTIAILTIIASLKWGKWKEWRKYQPGMFFIATGGLLYEYIVQENTLWKFHPDFLYGHQMTVIIYVIITMPISTFLFLSHFPQEWLKRLFYIILWSGIYISVEWVLLFFDRISYQNEWRFWYSFLFDLVMFTVIAIHQNHPVWAYLLSVFITFFLIHYFHIPFEITK